jgi:hypothetical protein
MAKPSLMEAFDGSKADEQDMPESDGAFDELRKRFVSGDPAEAKDAFMGLMSLCEEEGEGEYPTEGATSGKKPVLQIHIGSH